MRESITLVLEKQNIAILQQNLYDRNDVIDVLVKNAEAIQKLLVGYHYSEAGQVCNVNVKEDSLVVDSNGHGRLMVEYETHYFQACSGNRYDVNNKMTIDFAFIPYKCTLELTGEEILERTPDSY